MDFFSNTRKPSRIQEDFSNTKQAVFRKEIDSKTGERRLVKDREVDIYDKIQEYAEESKLSNVLQRYNVNMLSRVKDSETQLVDLTNLPENLLQALTTIDNAKYLWERQPKEFKAEFDNDFKKFIAGSENGKIMEILTRDLKTESSKFNTTLQANLKTSDVETPVVKPAVEPIAEKNNGGIVTNV